MISCLQNMHMLESMMSTQHEFVIKDAVDCNHIGAISANLVFVVIKLLLCRHIFTSEAHSTQGLKFVRDSFRGSREIFSI